MRRLETMLLHRPLVPLMKTQPGLPGRLTAALLLVATLAPSVRSRAADPAAPATGAPKVNYVYHAKVVRVIDGATVALDVDLGFHAWIHNQSFVLQGVAAPAADAADQAAAMRAKTRLQELLHAEDEVVFQSIRDKSGAYHAVIWKDGENINEKLGAPQDAPTGADRHR